MSSIKQDPRSSMAGQDQNSLHDPRLLHSSSHRGKREGNSKLIANKSKKKRLISNYDENRQREIRQANRIAARQCRQRKKKVAQDLEQTLKLLSEEHSRLSFQNEVLSAWTRQFQASRQHLSHGQILPTQLQMQQQLQQSVLALGNPGLTAASIMASGTVPPTPIHQQQHPSATKSTALAMNVAQLLQLPGHQAF